jgi:hypothetical protein
MQNICTASGYPTHEKQTRCTTQDLQAAAQQKSGKPLHNTIAAQSNVHQHH